MSQPIRYDVGMTEEICPTMGVSRWPWVYPSEHGKYVLHSDYYALAAENDRLRKAGDAVHRAIKVADPALVWAIDCWLAAKEGRDAK